MTIKRHFVKKAISVGLSATLALSAVGFSALATSDTSVFPLPSEENGDEPIELADDDKGLTATSQRAASEIPLVFGVNVVAGTLFNGPIDMAGTSVNENVDPYLWNYNFNANSNNESTASPAYNDGTVVRDLGTLYNADGLYSSGGGNQVYSGGAGNVDVFFGFNSNVYNAIVTDGGSAVVTDVQTGSATSRLYAWAEMGSALSGYLTKNTDKSVRYDDPYTIAVNLEQFSAGIPYYIAYLIDNGTLTKKTAAFVTSYDEDEEIFTCGDPAAQGDVRSDLFAEVNNFNFIDGDDYTAEDLEDAGVSLVILSATGYSYAGGSTGQSDSLSNKKAEVIEALVSGYEEDGDVPLVMSGDNYGITIGNNGYNYSPITCMFLPYVQTYAYMDQLSKKNIKIDPEALVEYMIDEFFHVDDAYVASVADYYIDDNWTLVSSDDSVPTRSTTAYGNSSKSAIESAIQTGIRYALGLSDSSTHTLVAAYRTNDTAYSILNNTSYTTTEPSDKTPYITVEISGVDRYILIDTVASAYPTLATYYGYTDSSETTHDGTYNYGWDLQETLQYYADHMNAHVWDPVTSQPGTYGYGLSALTIS